MGRFCASDPATIQEICAVLDLKLIRDNPETLKDALIKRGQAEAEVSALVESILSRDTELRQTKTSLQELQARRNQISKDVGKAKAAKDETQAQKLIAEMGDLKERVATGEAREKELAAELDEILAGIPNLPADDVPLGGEDANKEIRRWGDAPKFAFEPKQHFELGEALVMMDFLLYYSIPTENLLPAFEPGIILWVVLVSSLLMSYGLISAPKENVNKGKSITQNP
jgi:seryl-tRNA synthetase